MHRKRTHSPAEKARLAVLGKYQRNPRRPLRMEFLESRMWLLAHEGGPFDIMTRGGQTALAEELGVARSTVSRWLRRGFEEAFERERLRTKILAAVREGRI
ncbi:MAG: helix-turn-helix domain-containing protein [Sumerlaeia bacterium]